MSKVYGPHPKGTITVKDGFRLVITWANGAKAVTFHDTWGMAFYLVAKLNENHARLGFTYRIEQNF